MILFFCACQVQQYCLSELAMDWSISSMHVRHAETEKTAISSGNSKMSGLQENRKFGMSRGTILFLRLITVILVTGKDVAALQTVFSFVLF